MECGRPAVGGGKSSATLLWMPCCDMWTAVSLPSTWPIIVSRSFFQHILSDAVDRVAVLRLVLGIETCFGGIEDTF